MSADNGVYILATKGPRGKKDYRVAHLQAVENLWYKPDFPREKPELNLKCVVDLYSECRVFTDRTLAMGYALRIADEVWNLEYGIQLLDYTHMRLPKFVQERKQAEWEIESRRIQLHP